MDIEETAALCGLTVDAVRQGVAAKTFPLPRTDGGESWDHREIAQWRRAKADNRSTVRYARRPRPVIGVAEVLATTGLGEDELFRLVSSGEFPPARSYRKWRLSAVERWVAMCGVRKTLGAKP